MAPIADDFWPASLAHLAKPYLNDSSQYVTIGEISSEAINNFPGTRLLYAALVPADEVDEYLVRPGGIGHGILALDRVYDEIARSLQDATTLLKSVRLSD